VWHIGVGWGEDSAWLAIYQGRWTNSGDLFQFSGNSCGLHLGVQGVNDFLLVIVIAKLMHWIATHFSLVGWILIVNQGLYVLPLIGHLRLGWLKESVGWYQGMTMDLFVVRNRRIRQGLGLVGIIVCLPQKSGGLSLA
jgi:hypothetical protein